MPVTFSPSSQPLTPVNKYLLERKANDPLSLLQGSVRKQLADNCKEIFQSSFEEIGRSKSPIIPTSNGFIDTAIQAYNQHHHLIIRPDDVWMTILSQFNLFVNANAEQLRHLFVAHNGKKELEIVSGGNRYSANIVGMAVQMGRLIEKNVIDPGLRAWIIPDFTTTTPNDVVVSSVVMMATLKAYFSYKMSLMCGLPKVTLLGEKQDWVKILERLEKLPSFGKETAQWHSLLKPVISRFVAAFDHADSKESKDFWEHIAHYEGGGSGPTYLSGWITAFCFFDDKGKSMHRPGGKYKLDGANFHQIDIQDVPPAYAEVPVILDDNGQVFKTIMVAGLVGYTVSGKNDTLQPVSGWWMFDENGIEPDNQTFD